MVDGELWTEMKSLIQPLQGDWRFPNILAADGSSAGWFANSDHGMGGWGYYAPRDLEHDTTGR